MNANTLHHHFALADLNRATSRCLCIKQGAGVFGTIGVPWAEEADAYVPIPDALSGDQVAKLIERFSSQFLQFFGAVTFASAANTAEARDVAARIRSDLEQVLSDTLVRASVILENLERVLSQSGLHSLDAYARAFELGAWGWGEYTRAVLKQTAASSLLRDEINCMVFAPAVGRVFRRVWECSSETEKRAFLKRIDDPDALWDEFGLDADAEFQAA